MLHKAYDVAQSESTGHNGETKFGVGDRLRDARRSLGLSLQQVASKVGISIATLSRVENGKQAIDLDLFLQLTRMLECDPREVLQDASALVSPEGESLREWMGRLGPLKRARLWREMAADVREPGQQARPGRRADSLAIEVDELLAQMELIAAEITSIRNRMRGDE